MLSLQGKVLPALFRSRGFSVKRSDLRLLGGSLILLLLMSAAVFPTFFAARDPLVQDYSQTLKGPSATYLLGTDSLGRDILSRIIYGARYTLVVAALAVILASMVGVFLGTVAAYYGALVDEVVMRLMDILFAFPGIVLAIAVSVALGPGILNIIVAVGISSIPYFARVARGGALSVSQEEFVLAARSIGATPLRIMIRHIVANTFPSVILVQMVLRVASTILIVAALGFLGLGLRPPAPEWGQMMGEGRAYLRVAPHVVAYPGLAIMFAVLGINLVGDWLQDQLSPSTQRVLDRRE